MCNQRGYVLATFAQRREQNRKHVEAVVQVTAKFIARDHLSKIMMGRRHQTDINAMRTSTAQTLKLLLLQDAQQLRLQCRRQISNFIQEKGPCMCHFEAPNLLCDSPGKGAFLVAK